jgi:hypothetical protein
MCGPRLAGPMVSWSRLNSCGALGADGELGLRWFDGPGLRI